MRVITGIFVILAHLVAGNLLSWLIGGFMPGSVIGMVLLYITLRTGIVKEHWIRVVAVFLTDNMTMFFMPAFIGIMDLWGIISMNFWAWIAVLVLSTIVVMISSGYVHDIVERLLQKKSSQGGRSCRS